MFPLRLNSLAFNLCKWLWGRLSFVLGECLVCYVGATHSISWMNEDGRRDGDVTHCANRSERSLRFGGVQRFCCCKIQISSFVAPEDSLPPGVTLEVWAHSQERGGHQERLFFASPRASSYSDA